LMNHSIPLSSMSQAYSLFFFLFFLMCFLMLRILTDNNRETWILVIIFILVAKQIYFLRITKAFLLFIWLAWYIQTRETIVEYEIRQTVYKSILVRIFLFLHFDKQQKIGIFYNSFFFFCVF
jgi:hypothetical protein